ncbi:Phage repressor protein C, contains Cro/C1-type HTH and peptisase s24 domains [Sphingobium sp. YR768]|nr:Phage repressor protein C, contains Cro/C1-type HTH and peptisase s24 domains [Sphingobium sp. YR768]
MKTSDNRDCDIRKVGSNSEMDPYAHLNPQAADIFRLLDRLGLKQRDLAAALGLEENKISKVKVGERQFKAQELLRAREWLVEQDRLQSKSHYKMVPADVESLPHPDIPPTRNASADDGTVDIISLDLSLSMGPGTLIEDMIEEEPVKWDMGLLRIITRAPFHSLRQVRGVGDSMEPTLRTGDRVLIDTSDKTLSRMHGIYWIDHFGAHGLKRLRAAGQGRILIASENKVAGGPDFEVDADDLRIHGRAIWFGREL